MYMFVLEYTCYVINCTNSSCLLPFLYTDDKYLPDLPSPGENPNDISPPKNGNFLNCHFLICVYCNIYCRSFYSFVSFQQMKPKMES